MEVLGDIIIISNGGGLVLVAQWIKGWDGGGIAQCVSDRGRTLN